MGCLQSQLLRLPLFLKIISIVLIVFGVFCVVHLTEGPDNLLFGCGALALGAGVLLQKKWAWHLTLGTAIFGLYSACAVSFVLYTVWQGTLPPEGTGPVWLALWAAFNFVYGGFVLYYLTRARIRAVFGIYSTKTSP